jgi:hypothetical protein
MKMSSIYRALRQFHQPPQLREVAEISNLVLHAMAEPIRMVLLPRHVKDSMATFTTAARWTSTELWTQWAIVIHLNF